MWMNDIKNALNPGLTHIINDSKTPSGQVHVGSLRGVLIHDAIARHLKQDGFNARFTYGVDDYDPMDGLPFDAPGELTQRMGEPLCNIPAPPGSTASDFADHYIADFLRLFAELGVEADIYRMRDIYRSGRFNEAIHTILDNAPTVREIYQKVSGSERAPDWYPFQVICENCGKIGTTEVFAYENGEVRYRCRKDLVSWATGCSYEGRVSPLSGNGKLPWKLEWAAKWFVFGITVEGAGKDHCTKGGSRDIASQVVRRVFNQIPPLNVPYEFFLVNGAKMSSSKGVGASARAIADFLPPEVLRYLMVKTLPKRSVNFSVDLNPMLKVFNEYDALLTAKRHNRLNDEQQQLLAVVEVASEPKDFQPISFQLLVSMLQLPHINIDEEIAKRLGRALTEDEQRHLARRLRAADYWLKHYAAEEDKYELQDDIPPSWTDLAMAQKLFLSRGLDSLETVDWEEESLQSCLFDVARCTPVAPKAAFAAIYKLFLNKDSGPKAGALLSFLDRDYVKQRLGQACVPDWYACYRELGLEPDEFMAFVEDKKAALTHVTLTPELYLCVESDKILQSPDGFGFGFGVARVYFTDEQKAHSRLVKLNFEGYARIKAQQSSLLDRLSIMADELRQKCAINVSLRESMTLHVEVNGRKLDQYIAGLSHRSTDKIEPA